MALVVPNPTVPTNGQALDASPLLANLNAVYQAIQSFDAGQIQAGTLVAAAFNAAINPNTLLNETTAPFVKNGTCVWSTVSGLNVGMTSGIIYVNGIRVTVNSVASQAMAASKDTYIDIDVNGNITYNAVTNGAASPALTANSVRVAKIVSGASTITSITQSGVDSLLNLIDSHQPALLSLANQLFTDTNTGGAAGTRNYLNLGGFKFVWGLTNQQTMIANANLSFNLTWGITFTAAPLLMAIPYIPADNRMTAVVNSAPTTTTGVALIQSNGGAGTVQCMWIAIGV
jgi:hypothetical protein